MSPTRVTEILVYLIFYLCHLFYFITSCHQHRSRGTRACSPVPFLFVLFRPNWASTLQRIKAIAKLTVNPLQSGYRSSNALNANLDAIEAALENTLSRDGTSPNQMSAPLDMNSNRITNLAAPVSGSDAARLTDVMAGSGSFTADGTGAVERTFQDKLRDTVSAFDFIPVAEHAAISAGTSTYNATAAIQAAIDTGKTVEFPGGFYQVVGLTMSTNGQRLVALGSVNLQKRANGVILSSSANNIELNGITFRGDASTPTFTGDNILLTGSAPRLINCGSMWAHGRALKATGNNVVVSGSNPIWQTADATGTGYDIELGVSGTTTLYQQIEDYYSSQTTGGILFTDTGSAAMRGGQCGKITVVSGTSPAGSNGGIFTGVRITGNVTVGLSNGVFTGNQFSNVTFTVGAGTSGLVYVGNLEASGFSMVNSGTANQYILRHDTSGTPGYITLQYGASGSLAKLQVDPASGDQYILGGDLYLPVDQSVNFGTFNKRLASSSGNLALINDDGALQLSTASQIQAIAGGNVIATTNTTGILLASGKVIELGHASDTTLARVSAGDISVEGNLIYRANGALAASGGSALVGFLQSGTSATTRTVQAKLRDVINVKDFGATGDGTTDDTAFLQAAATAAGALKADLVIPSTGTFYKLTTELTIPANVRVYGGGHLKQTVVDKNAVIMSNDTSIENIKIEGPALLSVATIKNTGIQITGVSRVQVRNCDISRFETGGILLRNCFDVLIDGNYLHENDWQGSSPGASGGDIYSFSSTSSGRIIITNNFCMSNSSQGIGVADNGLEQDVVVANNVCITLDASGAVRASGTLVRRHAILLGYTSQTFPERRIICANNLVGNTQWTGIYAQVSGAENTPPIDISGNMIFDVGYDTTNALSGAVYVAARGTLPITVRNNTSLRCRNTLDNCGAFVAVSGGTGTTGVVVFENNVALDSSGNGMFIGALINDVSIKGHVSRNSTKKDVYYLSNPTHAPSKDFVWEGLDIVRNNTSDVAVSVTPDSGVTKRVKIKNFHIVGFDGTVNVTTNNALSIRYPLLTDVYDGEIDNFYRATNELAYAVATTRYFNTVIRDRIIVRNCVNGFGFGGTTTSSTWVAQDCIFINVTNKFHGSTIGGFIAGKEGRRNGDKLELYGFTAAPTTGTAAVGDRAPNQTPVVGQPKAWSVTVAGSPGTWVSEGNL